MTKLAAAISPRDRTGAEHSGTTRPPVLPGAASSPAVAPWTDTRDRRTHTLPSEHRIHISATEIPAYRRLVTFVTEVSVHADAYEDTELQDIVRTLRIDLLHLVAEKDTEEFDA